MNETTQSSSFAADPIGAIKAMMSQDIGLAIIGAIIVIILTALVSSAVTKIIRRVLKSRNTDLPDTIFINLCRIFVWGIGICIVLGLCFHADVSAILAALGIGGLAISLGLQDTISNVIGGVQLSSLGLLRKGDHVRIGEIEGIVQDITWRQTTINGLEGSTHIIPNSKINSNSITILPPIERVITPIDIPYEAVASYEAQGKTLDDMAKDMAEAIDPAVSSSAPEGMGLQLSEDVKVVFLLSTEFAIRARSILWIAKGQEFNPFEVGDAALRAVAPIISQGR